MAGRKVKSFCKPKGTCEYTKHHVRHGHYLYKLPPFIKPSQYAPCTNPNMSVRVHNDWKSGLFQRTSHEKGYACLGPPTLKEKKVHEPRSGRPYTKRLMERGERCNPELMFNVGGKCFYKRRVGQQCMAGDRTISNSRCIEGGPKVFYGNKQLNDHGFKKHKVALFKQGSAENFTYNDDMAGRFSSRNQAANRSKIKPKPRDDIRDWHRDGGLVKKYNTLSNQPPRIIRNPIVIGKKRKRRRQNNNIMQGPIPIGDMRRLEAARSLVFKRPPTMEIIDTSKLPKRKKKKLIPFINDAGIPDESYAIQEKSRLAGTQAAGRLQEELRPAKIKKAAKSQRIIDEENELKEYRKQRKEEYKENNNLDNNNGESFFNN